jgi:hypothetical protein
MLNTAQKVVKFTVAKHNWSHQIKRDGTYGGQRNGCRDLVEKPEGKKSLGRCRRRSYDNIRIGLKEIECESVVWISLIQDRDRWRDLVNTAMKLRVS